VWKRRTEGRGIGRENAKGNKVRCTRKREETKERIR
jgi:hypothetical protein